jgi:phosphoesterase RecJ-like protein
VLGNDVKPEDLHARYGDCDLMVIVDTNSLIQLPGLEDFIKTARAAGRPKILVIDHHVSGDNLGDVQLLDPEAAAAGEIVFDLFKIADWTITPRIAESIFIALSTDTGWFKYGNADSRIFHTAAELVGIGVHPNDIYQRLYQSFSPSRLALMTRMLEHLTLHADERIAIQYILRKDFDETGASGPDTENLIDECQRIGTVEVAVLLVELADGKFRCSLRSKGAVDVRAVAATYGGGGHTLAAGVTLPGPLDAAIAQLLGDISKQMTEDRSQESVD